jgi:hypothetical protein
MNFHQPIYRKQPAVLQRFRMTESLPDKLHITADAGL